MPHSLTIFVYEYLTSGACADVPLESSLMTEGRAMAEAIIADFASLEAVQVLTLRDHRLPAWESRGVAVRHIASPAEEQKLFHETCASADRILIIAPESQGVLQQRLEKARKLNPFGVLNTFGTTLEIGCDKWKLAEYCRRLKIPHLPTELWNGQDLSGRLPVVLKPRDGAGCEGIQLIREDLGASLGSDPSHPESDSQFVLQSWNEGVPLSSAACFSSIGERILNLPLGRQRLEIGESVCYQGGEIPWQHESAKEANQQAETIWRILEDQLEGLWGYVGVDWLWDEEARLLRLIEINPRLTTSYVGYGHLFGNQIADAWFNEMPPAQGITPDSVRFSANGFIEVHESEETAR